MNDDLWENYKSHSKTYFKHRFQYIDLDNISTQDELDHTWNIFEHSLHNIKKSTIPQKKITPQEHHHLYPLHIRQLNRHVNDNQSTYCSIDDLPLPWRTIYDPANHHSNSDCWDTLQQQIDISDVLAILKNSPSNKAPGPSQITYEDLKHLHKDVLILLTQIFNLCIHLDTIPTKWRDALLFPIPKPHDWDSKLTNTRPITLLETTRKLMVSVFLSKIKSIISEIQHLTIQQSCGCFGTILFRTTVPNTAFNRTRTNL
ncbi:cilia- and flagella-associated protein 57-like [Rhizophagus irregularis DAOM 181602=DAOM 197198]|nr:cilia- and flagella-associated protein 57-like [Rhizophagus irregularis DAOM 181602=DAOM 197198]